ncbi:energy transducer TonB [Cochlodiniinecator piscidefendens]|uniref:energy transducer TonB n=1 Tax=Cochlodiniinecator piscidefendens TaxID=2715756 RepID=UPI001E532B5A|nr:energy transducer TonB [Cochlodiniinecator piscidefendens]
MSEAEFAAIAAATAVVQTPPEPVEEITPPTPVETETPPEPIAPEVDETIPETPAPPSETGTTEQPQIDTTPIPRPADRVAPEPVETPEPEVEIADVPVEAVSETVEAEAPVEPREEAAQEEASTEIVTEAEQVDTLAALAPARSRRPTARPSRPDPVVEPVSEPVAEATPEPEVDPLADLINQAVNEANEPAETPRGPSGPPLTRGEREGLRVAVSQCWNVDVGSTAANVTVVVGMSMNRDATVVSNSLRLVSSEGGSGRAVDTAFQAARRAIIRCGARGYDLPIEKYEQWRDIEITFNPERMRTR